MIITRQSIITGKHNEMDLPVTAGQMFQWSVQKKLIQNVMPHLSIVEREFLITGMSEKEQEEIFLCDQD